MLTPFLAAARRVARDRFAVYAVAFLAVLFVGVSVVRPLLVGAEAAHSRTSAMSTRGGASSLRRGDRTPLAGLSDTAPPSLT